MKRFLGIDIGGTKSAVCTGDAAARVFARREFATGQGPDATLAALEMHARDLLQETGRIDAIGIVCGGPLCAKTGLVLSPPNLPGWAAVPVTRYFSERFGVAAFLQNDANAGALAEWRYGAGRGSRNLMFCTMGTGFGCGLILEGRLYEGTNGNAGELGHVRLTPDGPVGYGKAGSVEGFCGGGGIAQLARLRLDEHRAAGRTSALSELKALLAKSVAEAARQDDALALQIYAEVGEKLGRALALAVDLLNLDRIVVGSIFARNEALIRPAMERVMQEECLAEALRVCTVRAAELGDRIGDAAALTVAQNGLEAMQ
ncbi:MAG: ROK family protein [Opitutaceae bacterium]|nr:ROK family protein [Opitutaceae bacterium]